MGLFLTDRSERAKSTYKYHLKVGNKTLGRGIAIDLERRLAEERGRWPECYIVQIGRRTTREAALRWQRMGGQA